MLERFSVYINWYFIYIIGEAHLGKHGFFSTYVDVCRIRPGQDEDWTVGMTQIIIPIVTAHALIKHTLRTFQVLHKHFVSSKAQTLYWFFNAIRFSKHYLCQ